MKKILVGYDGTAQANDALHLGAGLADAVDARLLVASAIEFRSRTPLLAGYSNWRKPKKPTWW